MNQYEGIDGARSGRVQWGSYGFMAGILLGILMGWFFAGFVGAFIRVAMVAMAAVPLVLLYIAWRRYLAPLLRPPMVREFDRPVNAIETRAVVQSQVREPQPR
jgi:membrane protein implicated in regulation of membrane protease activity